MAHAEKFPIYEVAWRTIKTKTSRDTNLVVTGSTIDFFLYLFTVCLYIFQKFSFFFIQIAFFYTLYWFCHMPESSVVLTPCNQPLTHWGRNNMAVISQTIFSD